MLYWRRMVPRRGVHAAYRYLGMPSAETHPTLSLDWQALSLSPRAITIFALQIIVLSHVRR